MTPCTSWRNSVAKHIQRTSEDLLQARRARSPALHRLEAKDWVAASWSLSEKGKRARYCRLTALGYKYGLLQAEHTAKPSVRETAKSN
jgi:DNA-binding PadR family transcriptional regulator